MRRTAPLPASELLRPAPWKKLALLAISTALVCGAASIADRHALLAWCVGGFFGLCALVALASLLPGANHLRLDADGLEVRSLFRTSRWRWQDLSRFGPARVGLHTVVGLDFAGHVQAAAGMRQANRSLTGFDGALPDTYGLSARELAEKLEHWRQRHG